MKKIIIITFLLLLSVSVASASDTLSGFPVKIGQSFTEVQALANQYGYQLEKINNLTVEPDSYWIKNNQKHIGSMSFKNGMLSSASIQWFNGSDIGSLEKLHIALETVTKGRPITVKLERKNAPSWQSTVMWFIVENSNLNIRVVQFLNAGAKNVIIDEIID